MKKTCLAVLLLALVGLTASVILTKDHYRISQSGFEEKSFCNINQLIDCDTVLASPYAKMGPLLNSEWGVLYYLFVALAGIFVWSRGREAGCATLAFLFFSSILAVIYGASMAYISVVKIQALCLFCMVTYAVNLLLFLLLWRGMAIGFRLVPFLGTYFKGLGGRGGFKPYLLRHIGIVALMAGVGLLFFKGLAPQSHAAVPKTSREGYLKFYESIPKKDYKIPEGRPWTGDPQSKVVILEFSDFQCPFCRRAAFSLKPYLGELRNKVKIVFMNYPLDQACNPKITHSFHQVSCLAAKGSICAQKMGKFSEYHDLVFENQPKLSRALLLELAKKVGFDEEKFNQCIVSPEVDQQIAEDLALGDQLEVGGTPALFINGRAFRDWTNPERLKMVIEAELSPLAVLPPIPVN